MNVRTIDPYARYFRPLGLVASLVLALLPLQFPDCKQSLARRTLNVGAPGLTLIVLGVYDHMTLLQLLPKDGDDEGE
jgi:hypothetical protein